MKGIKKKERKATERAIMISDVIADNIYDFDDDDTFKVKTFMTILEKREFISDILSYKDIGMYKKFNFMLLIKAINKNDFKLVSKIGKILDTPPDLFKDEKKWLEVCKITKEEIEEYKKIIEIVFDNTKTDYSMILGVGLKYKGKKQELKYDDVLLKHYGKDYKDKIKKVADGEITGIDICRTLKDREKIALGMAHKYDFEADNIFGLYTMKDCIANAKTITKLIHNKEKELVGFYIVQNFIPVGSNFCIKFMFLMPEYRKKGYLDKLIKAFKKNYDFVSFDGVEDDDIIEALKRRDFKVIKPCDDGLGVFIGWSDKFDIEEQADKLKAEDKDYDDKQKAEEVLNKLWNSV